MTCKVVGEEKLSHVRRADKPRLMTMQVDGDNCSPLTRPEGLTDLTKLNKRTSMFSLFTGHSPPRDYSDILPAGRGPLPPGSISLQTSCSSLRLLPWDLGCCSLHRCSVSLLHYLHRSWGEELNLTLSLFISCAVIIQTFINSRLKSTFKYLKAF